MGLIKIKKGLNIPINGDPEQNIYKGAKINRVALVGVDYIGMKPTMKVAVGDNVKKGDVLFTDKKMPSVRYTSPGCGKVIEINRGEKRALLSVVIELEGEEEIIFDSYNKNEIDHLDKNKIISQLLESGLWTSLRTRPFSKVADPSTIPFSIFVNAMDTNPLAPSVDVIIKEQQENIQIGLEIISKLTDKKIYLCKAPETTITAPDISQLSIQNFSGPHPAGLVGTHIHFLDPVGKNKMVWHIGIQDVIAIGILFLTGKISVDRIISLAGPRVKKPRLVKTRLGACLADLTHEELIGENNRFISGSVLSGYNARGPLNYLSRYHQQVTVIQEGGDRKFLGWLSPGLDLFSIKNILLSKLLPHKKFDFTTQRNGGVRSIVPSGSYESVMPLDILPTILLRTLAVDDVEEAEKLGCLELDEEDLALCTYVCPSKIEHGPILRRNLNLIEKEG